MSARKGWIFDDPPPPSEWHDSHYSRMADRISASAAEERKWRIMMGNGQFLTDEGREAIRRHNHPLPQPSDRYAAQEDNDGY